MSPRLVYAPLAESHACSSRQYGWFVVEGQLREGLQPQEAEVLLAVMFAGPPLRNAELVEVLWGDDPEGGPLYSEKAVHVYVCRLNATLRRFGWQIKGRQTAGGYRLEKVSEMAA